MKDKITGPSPSLCRISFPELDGVVVCRIDVAASARPVFTCPVGSKDHLDFWVRQGNQTDQFRGTEQVEYIDEHWG